MPKGVRGSKRSNKECYRERRWRSKAGAGFSRPSGARAACGST
jgi:hypothetical protein